MQRGCQIAFRLSLAAVTAVLALAGCAGPEPFPDRPMRMDLAQSGRRLISYDADGDGRGDYEQLLDGAGRKVELRFGADETETVRLDEIDASVVPHFIIALDGVPYHLVEQLYHEGRFRLFYPPSKLISCFPSMTDLAFNRLFGGAKPIAYQAQHFDRAKNRMINGDGVYLGGTNADWTKQLTYRCSFALDALAYLQPEMVFEHEMKEMALAFEKIETGRAIGYSVGTAGLGTQSGREAILRYLREVDRFCEELMYRRRGRAKITLLADHGHNMAGRGRVSFRERLAEEGYRLRDRLEKPGDVVTVEYGLVTYAEFFTEDPAGVAQVLLHDPTVALVCYRLGEAVMVETLEGKAQIKHRNGRYRYDVHYGDPLKLIPIIDELKVAATEAQEAPAGEEEELMGAVRPTAEPVVDADGFINDRAFFAATADHEYPDPLRRIWMAFNGLVQQPADVIAVLQDGYCHGREFFDAMIGGATSTHGSLNRLNSTTFVLTMTGELPGAMRLEDVMGQLERLEKQAVGKNGVVGTLELRDAGLSDDVR